MCTVWAPRFLLSFSPSPLSLLCPPLFFSFFYPFLSPDHPLFVPRSYLFLSPCSPSPFSSTFPTPALPLRNPFEHCVFFPFVFLRLFHRTPPPRGPSNPSGCRPLRRLSRAGHRGTCHSSSCPFESLNFSGWEVLMVEVSC